MLEDILFFVTGSGLGNTFTISLPISGSTGSPYFIEAQTVYFENIITNKEFIVII
jgi:hypothetical protein